MDVWKYGGVEVSKAEVFLIPMPEPRKSNKRHPAEPTIPAEGFVRREIWLALLFFVLLLVLVSISGHFLRDEITAVASGVFHQLGFTGIAILLFLSETFVSPMPPDVILWIVASSELSQNWHTPVIVLGLLSTAGGHLAFLLGRVFRHTKLVHRILGMHHGRGVQVIQRFGIWAVVLASLTPLPWSVISWTTGALEMPWRHFFLASLSRLPRIVLYYIAIHSAFHGVAVGW